MYAHTDATHSGEREQKGKEKAIKLSLLIAPKADKKVGWHFRLHAGEHGKELVNAQQNSSAACRNKDMGWGMAP